MGWCRAASSPQRPVGLGGGVGRGPPAITFWARWRAGGEGQEPELGEGHLAV